MLYFRKITSKYKIFDCLPIYYHDIQVKDLLVYCKWYVAFSPTMPYSLSANESVSSACIWLVGYVLMCVGLFQEYSAEQGALSIMSVHLSFAENMSKVQKFNPFCININIWTVSISVWNSSIPFFSSRHRHLDIWSDNRCKELAFANG